MKPENSLRYLVIGATAILLAVGVVLAADVPWTFQGDDTREPANAATSAASADVFVSWTLEEMDAMSEVIRFSSCKPGFILLVR